MAAIHPLAQVLDAALGVRGGLHDNVVQGAHGGGHRHIVLGLDGAQVTCQPSQAKPVRSERWVIPRASAGPWQASRPQVHTSPTHLPTDPPTHPTHPPIHPPSLPYTPVTSFLARAVISASTRPLCSQGGGRAAEASGGRAHAGCSSLGREQSHHQGEQAVPATHAPLALALAHTATPCTVTQRLALPSAPAPPHTHTPAPSAAAHMHPCTACHPRPLTFCADPFTSARKAPARSRASFTLASRRASSAWLVASSALWAAICCLHARGGGGGGMVGARAREPVGECGSPPPRAWPRSSVPRAVGPLDPPSPTPWRYDPCFLRPGYRAHLSHTLGPCAAPPSPPPPNTYLGGIPGTRVYQGGGYLPNTRARTCSARWRP